MNRVQGKTAIVTGAAGGLGRAISRRLAENGARVVMADVDATTGTGAAAELAQSGAQALYCHLDVAEEASWARVIDDTIRRYGSLDILVNSAGIFSSIGQPFEAIPLDEWRRIMTVNLDGVFLGMRSAIAAMKKINGGAIVNIASTAGYIGTRAGGAYGASKGGVRALTVQAAYSCAKHGYNIRINSISPGYVWTPAIEAKVIREFGSREAAEQAVSSRNPLGRIAQPDDVAWAVVYLASDEARMVTAIDLVIDGGMLHS